METRIEVKLPTSNYQVAIAPGLIERLGVEAQPLSLGRKMLVVSNPTIFKHYGDRVVASLQQAGFQVATCLLPPGERHKTPSSLQKIYDRALAERLERSSTLVALGGGVIGDMTGFAAATWLRGINFIQVPTSLLAMVDAAIGGKTGINHPQGKNLIGAFYQPRLVVIDPQVLATLPPREWRAGMAEVIKYGVIWDAELLEILEQAPRLDRRTGITPQVLTEILRRSVQAKVDVVNQDEKESGIRAILNYGHTIGHGVESLTGYRVVNHGEAVAIGMVAAGKLAIATHLWSQAEAERQERVITKAGLPSRLPAGIAIPELVESLTLDKKVQGGKVRFILADRLGHALITDAISTPMVTAVLQALELSQ